MQEYLTGQAWQADKLGKALAGTGDFTSPTAEMSLLAN
ncbi:hypothetical protein C4K38_1416 [Pseudomonas chlororaphis subsp. piscium]|nr:hypothetical protein C4K38_1416 [Pseudomonas chlororaphis subsp. piscium]